MPNAGTNLLIQGGGRPLGGAWLYKFHENCPRHGARGKLYFSFILLLLCSDGKRYFIEFSSLSFLLCRLQVKKKNENHKKEHGEQGKFCCHKSFSFHLPFFAHLPARFSSSSLWQAAHLLCCPCWSSGFHSVFLVFKSGCWFYVDLVLQFLLH